MRIYKRLLASYLVVCLIPLIMSLFTAVKLEQNIRSSIIEDRINAIRTVQKELDRTISDAANTVSLLAQDPFLDELETVDDFSALDILSRKTIQETLSAAKQQQTALSGAFCYFYKSGHLITDSRTYVPQVIDVYSQVNGFSDSDFMAAMTELNVKPTVRVLRSTNGSVHLYILQNRYDSRYKEKLSCIGVVIQVTDDLLQWHGGSSEIFVTDSDGNLLYGSDFAERACTSVGTVSGAIEDMEIDLDGDTYLYSIYPSEVSSLQYGFLTNRAAYYKSVNIFNSEILLEFIFYLIVAVIFAWAISRRTWSPVQNIVNFMHSRASQIDDVQSLESLEASIRSIADEKEILENRLLQSHRRNQTLQLGLYLTGNADDYSTLTQYIEEGQFYRVLMLWAENPEDSEFFLNVPQNRYKETMQTLGYAMQNILEETLLERNNGVSLMIERTVVLILQTDENDEELRERVHSALTLTETALSLRMGCLSSRQSATLSESKHLWRTLSRLHAGLSFLGDGLEENVIFAETLQASVSKCACVSTEESPSGKNSDFVRKVQAAIEQNYRDPSLNASMLASQMGMTLTNFCHKYKSASGRGVLDEIHLTRLREAKRLLTSGLSVRETAERTGYLDARAMNRAFKRYEDSTPSEYKQKNT